MSQGKDNPRLLNFLSSFDTLFYVHSQRLLAEYVEAPSGKLDCELGMHPVLNANDNCHCNPWLALLDESVGCGEQFLVRYEDILDGDTILAGEDLASLGTRFGYCNYPGVVRMAENEIGEILNEGQ